MSPRTPWVAHFGIGAEGSQVDLLGAVGGLDHLLGILCVGFAARVVPQRHPGAAAATFAAFAVLGAATLTSSMLTALAGGLTIGVLGVMLLLPRHAWGRFAAIAAFGATYGAEQAGTSGAGSGLGHAAGIAATVAVTGALLAVGYLVGVEAGHSSRLRAVRTVLGALTVLSALVALTLMRGPW